MSWARFESTMPRHPKIVGLSVPARWAFVEIVCWAVEQATDGEIAHGVPFSTFTTSPSQAGKIERELVAAGLLEQNGSSLLIHDFGDYQTSGAAYKERRADIRERKRKARAEREGDA